MVKIGLIREFLDGLRTDLRFSLHLAGRQKGWTAIIVLSLALGIGASTVLFSAIDSVLLKTIPVPGAGRLVAFHWAGENSLRRSGSDYGILDADPDGAPRRGATFPLAAFTAFRNAGPLIAPLVEDVFAFAPSTRQLTDVGGGRVTGWFASGNYFGALGVSAVRGRLLTEEDDAAGAEPVTVIGEGYWQQAFGGDPDVVGRSVLINDVLLRVVGVAPAGLGRLISANRAAPDFTMPLSLEAEFIRAATAGIEEPATVEPATGGGPDAPGPPEQQRWITTPGDWRLMLMARKRPGVADDEIRTALGAIFGRAVREDNQQTERPRAGDSLRVPELRVVDGRRGVYDVASNLVEGLTLLSVVFGILLAVISVNLASLVLARSERRRAEMALRAAMGASRRRLARQILTESVVLAGVGGMAALGAAYAALPLLPGDWLSGHVVDLDVRGVGFGGGLVLLLGAVCGLPAAWRSGGAHLEGAMKDGAATRHRARLGKSLVALQVGLSLVLLVGAGLFLRTFLNLQRVPTGFNPDGLLIAATFDFAGEAFPLVNAFEEVNARARRFYDALGPRLKAAPEIQGVSYASSSLLGTSGQQRFSLDGERVETMTSGMHVGEDFFQTAEIPLIAGRLFLPEDFGRGPPVVIVNEAFARAFMDGRPLARRLLGAGFPDSEVVGIVADVKHSRLRAPAPPMVYVPLTGREFTFWLYANVLFVRHSGDPATLTLTLRRLIAEADPDIGIPDIRTQRSEMESLYGDERYFAILSASFAAVVLLVAMIGLFGLMSWLVARRTREIGIRMALGAEAGRVRLSVLRETWALMALGIVLGLPAALAATRLIESRLFDVTPNDPVSVIGAAVVMLAVGTLAAWVPARRASGVDPLAALRHD